MYKYLIKNGKIIDGSGTPWFKGDIAIKDGKIVKIGRKISDKAKQVIDANGLVVSPGFIDIHTHSDLTLLVNGRAESKIRQGVTTEVIGNCGSSPAPAFGAGSKYLKEELNEFNLDYNWKSYEEYLKVLENADISVNVVPLVGHGALRRSVLGYEQRKANLKELNKMKELLVEALKAGARGFSSGLIYPPSSYADTEELIELAKTAVKYGGIYTTHMRYEGEKLVEGVKEAIKIGEESGIPVQISHHKVTVKNSWGLVHGTLAMMKEARKRGVDVSCDVYPYPATSTGLDSILPDWAHEGGNEKLLQRLEDEESTKKIIKYLEENERPRGFENIVVTSIHSDKNKKYEGKNIKEISENLAISAEETVIKIVFEEKVKAGMIRFAMCESDIKKVISDPLSMICSDAGSVATYGKLAEGKPHPRAFGSFARVLGKYVREEEVISLEEAVYKMTGLSAWRLNLENRGLLKEGMAADICIFDENEIIDKATFTEPLEYAQGIKKVIVNGEVVIDEGKHSSKMPGIIEKNTGI
ncbi:MAG: N-acyl-D-amino-acid deacylase family protein [Bacillota bacterium]